MKSLFDMGCFDVWIYSPMLDRSIHQTKENYVRFLDTEWIATSTDDNEIINLLSNIPHSNDQVEQTLLFVSTEAKRRSLKTISNFITKLKEIRQKQNIVILCSTNSPLFFEGKKWLDNQNVIIGDVYNKIFNTDLHRILIDLANNPQYDWRERYTGGIKNKCKISNNTKTFIWPVTERKDLSLTPEVLFVVDLINDFFINMTIHFGSKIVVKIKNGLVDMSNSIDFLMAPYKFTDRQKVSFLQKNATVEQIKEQVKQVKEQFEEQVKEQVKQLKEQLKEQFKEQVKDIGDNQVHIIFFYKETAPNFNQPPFTFNNTIKIIIDDNITDSPMMTKDGDFMIWEIDTRSPLFTSMLIEKMYSILC
uniref:Uncharacterized protein n=1 Tax=Clytia hemisphaerica TaxID=252671 RepID=A0A7M5XKQ2_9CNID